jgi:hypothetical protein
MFNKMKQIFSILFLFSIFAFTFYSCKKDDGSVPDMGYSYFPTQVGTYVIYDVDSTYYDDFYVPVKATNYKFLLKEKIESVFMDNQNRPTLRLERYVKYYDSLVPYSSQSWILRDVWAANLNNTTAEKVEENVRYTRLIFPVRQGKVWDGNVQNIYDERDFSYVFVDAAFTVGKFNFKKVLETLYDDGGSILTSREYHTEKYAQDVGMVYRQEIVVQSQPKSGATTLELQTFYATPIMQRITSGYQYSMTVRSYGKE